MNLPNQHYQKLISHYDSIQAKNANLLRERVEEIYQNIPEIKAINESIAGISASNVLKALGQPTGFKFELPQSFTNVNSSSLDDIDVLSEKKRKLLAEHGYPEDYLEPIYDCPHCKDTGYVDNQKCSCFKKRIVEFLYEESNIKDIIDKENFDNFSFECYPDDYIDPSLSKTPREQIQKAYNMAIEFCEKFDEKHPNLLIYGKTGVGKTFLSHCIAKEMLDKERTVVYLSSIELFNILSKANFDKDLNDLEKSTTVSYIMGCDLLVIDDLGTELINSFTSSQLYQIINKRLIKEQSTIISTNLNIGELEDAYSERIFSRLTYKYTLLKIIGDDIRTKI